MRRRNTKALVRSHWIAIRPIQDAYSNCFSRICREKIIVLNRKLAVHGGGIGLVNRQQKDKAGRQMQHPLASKCRANHREIIADVCITLRH